ncbi:MAG TPA: hypothetical protein VJT31_24120 [Rugosimonospora sp.]|nr:hypothetical protein [Rugosimonospora sp.]
MSSSAGPERLDERIRVVTVPGWISLATGLVLVAALLGWAALGTTRTQVGGLALLVHEPHAFTAQSPVDGVVTVDPPPAGTLVTEGQQLAAVTRADAPYAAPVPVLAPITGQVVSDVADHGTAVVRGQYIAYLELRDVPLVAQVFVPTSDGKRVQAGMAAEVEPSIAPAAQYGLLRATVSAVSSYSLSPDRIRTIVANDVLAGRIINGPPVLLVTLSLTRAGTRTGFAWTSGTGPPFAIDTGTLATATITLASRHPLGAVFGGGS